MIENMPEKIEIKSADKQYLECILTDDELIERSRSLAKANQDLADVEARKKDVMADFTAQQKKHEANIGVLSRKVSTGKEYRDVECEWSINFTSGFKALIRKDTREIIKTEPVTSKDRQESLLPQEDKAAA